MTTPLTTPPHPFGIWHVTTEGDCEGRSTKDLGVHEGFLDDIAFALSAAAYYGLKFDPVEPKKWKTIPARTEAIVSLNIGSGTWDLPSAARVRYFTEMMAGRDVQVVEASYYASVTLVRGRDEAAQELARQVALRQAGLAKLSMEERAALGLTLDAVQKTRKA